MSSAPLVYLVYGVTNSGRREVIYDLIEGSDTQTEFLLFRPDEEIASPFDEQIEALSNVSVVGWKLNNSKVVHGPISADPEKIIFLAPGTSDPSDVAEALRSWAEHNNCEVARIFTVVHCSFFEATPAAQSWFDACLHFSDVVLLNRREGVSNKWIKELEQRYKKECAPARFIPVKKGRVANPQEVLLPEARRSSLYFDELIPIEDDGLEEAEQPDDLKPDKYIERRESGQRAYPVPDIKKIL
jgi:hypothetical protein